MAKAIEDKDENAKKIQTAFEAFERENENRIKAFENNSKKIHDVIEEKDSKIISFEKQLYEMDNKMSQFVKNEDSVKSKQKKIIKCPLCDFEASSERGLKTHKTRIHTASTLLNEFPKKCELCDVEVTSKSEFKRHVRTHSYKEANFQCNECDKVCESEFEMEVHISKSHSEDFDCVLCGFEAKDLDNLRVHFVTCEIYRCGICEKKFTKLSDIKHHV